MIFDMGLTHFDSEEFKWDSNIFLKSSFGHWRYNVRFRINGQYWESGFRFISHSGKLPNYIRFTIFEGYFSFIIFHNLLIYSKTIKNYESNMNGFNRYKMGQCFILFVGLL